MATFRINKDKNYTVISNYHLRDKELSLKAKGLLSLMLSLPDNWDYSVNGLVAISLEGKSSITSTIKELEEKCYLVRTLVKDNQGKFFGYNYDVYEKPLTDKPCAENPSTVNQPQLNTKQTNTKKINTKVYIDIVEIEEIVNYLNEKTGKHFRHNTDKTKKLIKARIREGFTVDDFKRVIDTKTKQWGKDKKMKIYLRPETLFGNKFESYLNEEPPKEHYDIKIDHSDLQNYNFDDIDF